MMLCSYVILSEIIFWAVFWNELFCLLPKIKWNTWQASHLKQSSLTIKVEYLCKTNKESIEFRRPWWQFILDEFTCVFEKRLSCQNAAQCRDSLITFGSDTATVTPLRDGWLEDLKEIIFSNAKGVEKNHYAYVVCHMYLAYFSYILPYGVFHYCLKT